MFCTKFQIPVQEVSLYMSRLIRTGLVVEIKRENIRGRPLTPLLVALEPGQVLPKPEMVKTAQTERIRHAYFEERKSIKQVAREFHHDRRTVRRAIHKSKLEAVASV
jgi:DNA invertase Pin-like site-specific DNA recombinase